MRASRFRLQMFDDTTFRPGLIRRCQNALDRWFPPRELILRTDGRVKYLPGNDRGDDVLWQEKLREERLREAGFEVVRMTWAQVTREPHETCRRIRAAFGRQQCTLAAG